MLRIAICDDDIIMLDFLQKYISECFEREHIRFCIDSFSNGKDILKAHKDKNYNILFLDIGIPDISGFELAEAVRQQSQKTSIVFVSANDHLVFESFKYQPFYFVRKSDIDSMHRELDITVEKLIKIEKTHGTLELLSVREGTVYTNISDILYVESIGHYLNYSTIQGKVIVVRAKISDVAEYLSERGFMRIHRSYLVNMHNISSINRSQKTLTIKNGTCLNIGRTYEKLAISQYMEYSRGNT